MIWGGKQLGSGFQGFKSNCILVPARSPDYRLATQLIYPQPEPVPFLEIAAVSKAPAIHAVVARRAPSPPGTHWRLGLRQVPIGRLVRDHHTPQVTLKALYATFAELGGCRVGEGRVLSRLTNKSLVAWLMLSIAGSVVGCGPVRAATPIQHVIIIMQENRSFDHYFGTYPGADGIPSGTCVPLDPKHPLKGCVTPFHDPHETNSGGVHRASDAQVDLDDGITRASMDGFVLSQLRPGSCPPQHAASCGAGIARHDVVGYHDANELSNYWVVPQFEIDTRA